jgi:hypothetical protein
VETQQVQGVLHPAPHHLRIETEVLHGVGELVLDHVGHEAGGGILAHHADHVGELTGRELPGGPSVDQDLAGQAPTGEVGHQAVDGAEQRRLPRAGGSHHDAELAFAESQVDPIERRGRRPVIGEGHVDELDHAVASTWGAGSPEPVVLPSGIDTAPASTGAAQAGTNPIRMPTAARTGSVGGPNG